MHHIILNTDILYRADLLKERDNHLVKEKIIEDQSNTISQLQNLIKEKSFELNKAREDNNFAEEEIVKVNESLVQKHMELEKEVNEKKRLTQKLQVIYFNIRIRLLFKSRQLQY